LPAAKDIFRWVEVHQIIWQCKVSFSVS